MRQLSFLLLGLVFALLGVQVVAGAEGFASHLLRDGLLVATLGGLIFALNAAGWRTPQPAPRRSTVPPMGQMLLLTGIVVALVAGIAAGAALPGLLGLSAWLAWLLGAGLMLAGAWWPDSEVEYVLPAVRWEKDAAGNFVAVATEAAPPAAGAGSPRLRGRTVAIWLALLLAGAALLRVWNLAELPPGCIGDECVNALRLVDGEPLVGAAPGQLNLFERLARLALTFTDSGVLSLRIAAALCGWLTVLAMFGVTRRLAGPLNALLATALLALSPWHLWAGRSSDPWVAVALLVAAALWLLLQALAHANVRWWAPAGIALGLLLAEAPPLRLATGLWIAAACALAIYLGRRSTMAGLNRHAPLVGLAAVVATALPALLAAGRTGQLLGAPSAPEPWLANAATLLGSLLRPDVAVAGPFVDAGLLVGMTAALAVAGMGVLLRHVRRPAALATLAGALLIFVAAIRVDLTQLPPASVLLAWLPFVVAQAAVALDAAVGALLVTWGAPLLRPSRLAATVALVLLLVAGRHTVALMANLDAVSTGSSQVETDIARFIAQWKLANPDRQSTFVVPASVLGHPSLRLLAGSALTDGRIQPLEIARTMPFAGKPPGDLLYLVPLLDSQVIGLLRELYPNGVAATQLDAAGERSLFNTFQVTAQDLRSAQGLQMVVFPGHEFGAGGQAGPVAQVDALAFPWATQPPLEGPFSVQWHGSLIVPEAGSYTFGVDGMAPDARLLLKLDDLLMLDTMLGVAEQSMPLAQGVYRVGMSFRSGSTPSDLRVRWQQPGTELQVIQGRALHTPVLADQGLIGDYYPGSQFAGAPLARRKDAIVGMDSGLASPYSVRWQGQFAAPRAGEYLIGAAGDGFTQITIGGNLLINRTAIGAEAAEQAYNEALIYLPAGWHPIEVRHAPEQAPQLRLLWQPAGGAPGELTGQNLLPRIGEVTSADAALPVPPPLAAPQLGDDQFALSQASPVWQPVVRIPPQKLPPLPLEALWVAGNGCGAGDDQLNAPRGLAFSRDGARLYVADTGNRRVVVYDIDGGLNSIAGSALFEEPVDVDFTPEGTPLVLDAVAQQIFRLDPSGTPSTMPLDTSFYRPRGLGVDPSGNLVVADTGGARIVILSPDGSVAAQFGGQGSLLARGQPVDALATAQAIWAISAEDGRLWNLSADGSLTAVQPGNTIDGPHLAQLADGRILASDPARATFLLFSPRGEPIGQFGYAGQLAVPTGIATSMAGETPLIAVSDTRQCTVSLWRLVE